MSQTAESVRERFAPELPEAIRKQKAAVEEMMRAAATEQPPAAPAGGQEAPEGAGGEGEQTQPVEQGPQATPPADPVPQAKQEVPSETRPEGRESADDIQRKLAEAIHEAKTWKGRERKTREETEALQARIADLEARLEQALSAPPSPPEPELTAPSADEIDAYGADLLEITKRFALADLPKRIEKALAPILERLEALEAGVGQVRAKEAKSEWEKFCDRLRERVPGYEEIDRSEEFVTWLDIEDEVLGVPYRKGLEIAAQKLDDVRAAKVFDRFLTQTGKKSRGSQDSKRKVESASRGTETQEFPGSTAPEQDDRPSLEALAAPGRPSSPQSAPLPIQPGARVWTQAEIQQYYRDRAAGRHPDSRDPKKALETDTEIAMAQREGRIRA
jgi:hypothetical protein